MDKASRSLLRSVLSLPTMSFHEAAVATFVRWYAAGLGLKVREDRAGNILVRYEGRRGGRAGRVTFAAHMDHPGFEVISSSGRRAKVALWGKVNPRVFAGASVIVYTRDGLTRGRIGPMSAGQKHLRRPCFALKALGDVRRGDWGHYDLPAVRMSGGIVRTRAADNLVSVAATLDLMTRLKAKRAWPSVTALFTRGEESGFLGAMAAMELGTISNGSPIVVLECSSAPGGRVDIGGGPVIRAGDLQSTFDPEVEIWLSSVARSTLKAPGFKFQRALLQGGRCEACVYVAMGLKAGGLALPLGNYHNEGPSGPAAEYISEEDYTNHVRLMEALALSPMPRGTLKKSIAPIWRRYRELKGKFLASG